MSLCLEIKLLKQAALKSYPRWPPFALDLFFDGSLVLKQYNKQ